MKTLYVHIGTHKTGTTSIQAFLRRNAVALLERGIYVPASCTPDAGSGHHNIGFEMQDHARFNPAWGTLDDLGAELAACPAGAAVISSENLEYLVQRPDLVARIESVAERAGFVPVYLVCFRERASYAASLYHELNSKHGVEISFGRFLREIFLRGSVTVHGCWHFEFDYARFLRRWPSRHPIRPFAYEQPGGVLPAFLDLIGAEALRTEAAGAERLNVAPPHAEPRWMRRLFRLRFPRRWRPR